jgi:hypothetical protein
MPLVISDYGREKITDLSTILGKQIIDETDLGKNKELHQTYDWNNVIFKSQLPENVVLIDQATDQVALTGAMKSGMIPVVVDSYNYVTKVPGAVL